jgi:hypothetical protein
LNTLLTNPNIDADVAAIADAVRRSTPPGRPPLRSVTVRAASAVEADRLRSRLRTALAEDGWGEVEVEVEIGSGPCGLVAIEVSSKA